jgi:hypothetical protein
MGPDTYRPSRRKHCGAERTAKRFRFESPMLKAGSLEYVEAVSPVCAGMTTDESD